MKKVFKEILNDGVDKYFGHHSGRTFNIGGFLYDSYKQLKLIYEVLYHMIKTEELDVNLVIGKCAIFYYWAW